MLWWVLGALALVVIAILGLSAANGTAAETEDERALRRRRESRKEVQLEQDREAKEREAEFLEARAASVQAFEHDALRGWPFKKCKMGETRAAIAFEPRGSTFVVVHYKDYRTINILSQAEYDASDVLSVQADQLFKSYDRKIVDYQTVETRKNKSAIGRGVAGAVVAGPVGAIVGAVSALTPTVTTERVASVRYETTKSKGDSRVILHMSDMASRPLVMDFAFESDAHALVAWIDAHRNGSGR
ncbi:hypothetical protein KOAAANKH_01698 [Brevundimonas sp. NIBR10]|uniref:hypothetical protein n=1 Tax=Brevundimonas sp. NIBR10 TaxID=3015997 RepID=UPI0022F199C0|nr:hypothetical protein [Brevundimonas sp. NIBR10]WGM46824.1 hypothetical protein KOAAANKH_01698 [Brevundimonas sp. NIBR10]